MSRQTMYIAVAVAVVVVGVFIFFGFFGTTGTTTNSTAVTPAQELLNDIAKTGSVSELRLVDTVVGTGEEAKAGDSVTVNYTGVLPDGTVFDSSQTHGQAFTFTLGSGMVIKGWDQGVAGMHVGGTRILAIPAELGYGANAVGTIPPNSTLIFQVDLLSVTHPAK